MTCLVSYDVSDDSRRSKLVGVLLDYGQRVLESVFWIDVEEELITRMRERMAKVVTEDDGLWVVPVCAACARRVEATGRTRVPELPEWYLV